MKKARSGLEKERKQLKVESSGLYKTQGLKKGKIEKVSSELEKERKQLKAESSGQQDSRPKRWKNEKSEFRARKGKKTTQDLTWLKA